MAKKKRKRIKRGSPENGQILGVFVFFLLLRIFLLFFYQHASVKYVDIMSVFLCHLVIRLRATGIKSLIWGFLAGLLEDIFSGGVLGVNAFSKTTMAQLSNFIGRKVEISSPTLQIPSAILLFITDIAVKYFIVSTLIGLNLSDKFLISIAVIKVAVNTIIFLVTYAVLR